MLGRYLLADAIAAGGMATIHLGRLLGPVGFARTVAIKRLHPQFAKDPEFVAAFLDEARLAARIQHPNVAQTLDVVATEGELFLVMEYVVGESLARLMKRLRRRNLALPPPIASAVVTHTLYGLHAAHDAKSDDGEPLAIVHRDVSPHNILVGVDGITRVVDFGIAKAAKRTKETEVGRIKGKIAYMAPEQVKSEPLDRRSDVFAAGIVLWEALTGRRLFEDTDPFLVMSQVLEAPLVPPSRHMPALSPEVDAVVMRALSRPRELRFQTAREMAIALERALMPALSREVGEWVENTVGDEIRERGRALSSLEREESESGVTASLLPTSAAGDDATADYQHSVVAELRVEPTTEVTTRMPMAQSEPAAARAVEAAVPIHAGLSEQPGAGGARRTVLTGAGVGALVFIAIVLGVTSLRGSRTQGTASGAPETSAPATTGTPLASASAGIGRAPAVSDASAPGAESSQEPATPALESADLPTPRPVFNSKPVPRVPKSPKPNCTPPYWVDGDGIKHYKKECNLGK